MKKAFTLVELLVVISIISMLASIVMVRISLAQASGRDAVRTQEVHQIDLATKLYIDTYKKAPAPQTGCDVLSNNPSSLTFDMVSGCIAVSTASVGPQKTAWENFKAALDPFLKVPDDPCKGACVSSSAFPIGYTYVAPLAMQYYCANGGNCVASNESYQVYAPMERQSVPTGSSGSTGNYFAATPPPALPSLGTINVIVRLNSRVLSASEASTCVSTVYFENYLPGDTAGCVRSWGAEPLGTMVNRVVWQSGYPVGADTSKTPTISPSYPQTLNNPPMGVNPLIYYIDFQ